MDENQTDYAKNRALNREKRRAEFARWIIESRDRYGKDYGNDNDTETTDGLPIDK